MPRTAQLSNLIQRPVRRAAVAVLLASLCAGCAAFTNPVANGIPAHLLPEEYKVCPREGMETIPLTWLRRKPPREYRIEAGDVLAVFIEGILGTRDESPPVNFQESSNRPPSLGYPVPVDESGRILLPLVDSLTVHGMTVSEIKEVVEIAYTSGEESILQPGRTRILVNLLRPRHTRVLVIRRPAD